MELVDDGDFFLRQIGHVHRELKAQWARQHRSSAPLQLPFAWVLSRTLRLLEEYPDGLTEAVILTELTAQLHHRERLSIKRSRTPTLEEILDENDEAVVAATVLGYVQHCITIKLSGVENDEGNEMPSVSARMFLHQRFRACIAAMASLGATTPNTPFLPGREIVFTNAKVLEKKTLATTKANQPGVSVLPTPYLALVLTPADAMIQAQALSFAQVDVMASQELPDHQAPSLLQELVVKARVVDIGAIRPCTTPYHVQRQVIMLADATTPSHPLTSAGSHVLILWDDQVALSRLFHVGDTLTLLHPFIHVCTPDDAEMVAVYEEYSSQQRCTYYLEYGSATTLFVSPRVEGNIPVSVSNGVLHREELQLTESQNGVSVGAAKEKWVGFSMYGQVAKIHVSHGIPLLAAFFYSYYDPKTQGRLAGVQRPSLDRAVVSKYYLVVLIELYDATSSETRTLELTGTTANKALKLREGQTVYIEGLVAVDVRGDATIQTLRDEKAQHKLLTQVQDERVRFAFPNRAYKSPIVALSSDWESIFGSQSDSFRPSTLFVINEIPGVIRMQRPLHHNHEFISQLVFGGTQTRQVSMVSTRFTIARVGWLIPDSSPVSEATSYRWDESCERGFSTMLAHRACRRPLEMATAPPGSALPHWKCAFCHELFAGMDATVQTYCDLVLAFDDGSLPSQSLHAICHGDTVSVLLGVPAEAFSQLSLPAKRAVLRRAVGGDYAAIVSRARARRVAPNAAAAAAVVVVDLRVDQLQPLDAFATAQTLLAQLPRA